MQIVHRQSGILVHSIDGAVYYLKQLLSDPEFAKHLGMNGKEQVKHGFLITRNLRDYLLIFLSLVYKDEINYL